MAFFLGTKNRGYYVRLDPFNGYQLTDCIEEATPFRRKTDPTRVIDLLQDKFRLEIVEHILKEVVEPVSQTKYTLKYVGESYYDNNYFHPKTEWANKKNRVLFDSKDEAMKVFC